MTNYQRITVSTGAEIGEPAPLPADLMGLTDDSLADLSAALNAEACEQLGYAGQGFLPVADPEPEPVVPEEVPMYKVTRLLITMGLLDTVEAALAGIPGVEGKIARPNWQRAPNMVRSDPLVQGMATQLGFDLDAMLTAANALT